MPGTTKTPHPPSGTVTFLFTDIVGSTEAWETHGDAFLPILQAHNAILQDSISRFGGFIVKMEGDCYKVAFSDPVAAAKCAVVAQAALHRYPWPADVGCLSVRMALHTGEPFMQAGDYFGPPVNRTARILSASHGGQILMSADTFDRIENRMDEGTRFVDLGFHRLKDMGEPARLFQLEHPRLELHSFPPPRTLNAHDNNLPVQRRSFVGREKEIEQIAAMLSRPDTPLLTLTGPGGIGKTRLSLEVAAEKVELFPDGVWYIRLDTATDLDGAATEVADTLGITIGPGVDALETVRTWLADRSCLLILDDCGKVPQADRLIRQILSGSTNLRCLATSRESLHIEEGAEIHVPEFSIPEENAGALEVMASEGGRLFVERSHEANPRFALNDERAKPISRLLNRIRATPELIEKAAGMFKKAQPAELAEALGEEVVEVAKQMGQAASMHGRELLERLKDSSDFATLLHGAGLLQIDKRELAEAERNQRKALAIYRRLGEQDGIAMCLWELGKIAYRQQDLARSVTLLDAALRVATEIKSEDVDAISVDLAISRRALGMRSQSASVSLDQAVALAMGD